ncbi:MAG: UDP-N-acetylmuramoyl-L-alanyl-D-glutamate--2,6-diaminopimelate ligase [Eubacteriaceae bacterium]|nr:UDP-N-acetylmuramoyl-L-alanyl-D-glutamate--2,6-diaminopimelate ligase [Eubacteriaceae bacterium]
MKLSELLEAAGFSLDNMVYGDDKEIFSLMTHSGSKQMGSLFFAIKGERSNGVEFIEEAVRNGAVAIVSQEEILAHIDGVSYVKVDDIVETEAELANALYETNSERIKKIAVTGTNGKTSFVYIANDLFNKLGKKSAYTGTLGTSLKVKKHEIPTNTTYTPVVYGKLVTDAKKNNCSYIFSEVSSQGIAMGRVRGLKFDYAVFMNLTEDHLDYHKTMESYYQNKKKLFSQSNVAVVNVADAYGARLYSELKQDGHNVYSFGFEETSDFMLSQIKLHTDSTSFHLTTKEFGSADVTIPAIGEHNCINSSIAAAIALLEGESIVDIAAALGDISQVPGRLELVHKGDTNVNVYVDYAHTPDAIEKAIESLRALTSNALTVVFGCGGNRDAEKRPIMGKIASENADLVVVTNDNYRNEDPNAIIEQIVAGMPNNNYVVIPDRGEAIRYAITNASKSDTVLLAGKGHENYLIEGDSVRHFSDKEFAMELLSDS